VVNEPCGHSAGEPLLPRRDCTVALHVRAADLIARLGGDEFGILVQALLHGTGAAHCGPDTPGGARLRFTWEQNTASIGASIGLVEINRSSESVAA